MGVVKKISPFVQEKEESPILEELRAMDRKRASNAFLKYYWNDKKKRRKLLNAMKEKNIPVTI